MTVGELKELLKELPDNHIVILSSDAEGNKYSPLSDITEEEYDRQYNEKIYIEDINDGKLVNDSIILWPI